MDCQFFGKKTMRQRPRNHVETKRQNPGALSNHHITSRNSPLWCSDTTVISCSWELRCALRVFIIG
jgi:hypothetical protein